MVEWQEIGQTNGVRMSLNKFSAVAGLILLGTLSASASTTSPSESRPAPSGTLQGRSFSDEMTALESLREDVGRHPKDFMIFETRIAANRFIAEHEGAYHESESRVVQRGVVGYWQGKTLVVLPSLSISDWP
jgi:hypothetical protein